MATEKTWRCRINKNCNGDDGTATAQNWMFEYFTFLSGGEGGVGAWTIMSSSDASTVVSGGINITAASDFTFAVSNVFPWNNGYNRQSSCCNCDKELGSAQYGFCFDLCQSRNSKIFIY